MNIDKGYELVCELWKNLGGDNKNAILPNSLRELKNIFEAEIKIQAAKGTGGTSQVKRLRAASKYLADAGKRNKRLSNAWYQNDKFCFSNGYTGFILNDKLDIPLADSIGIDLFKCLPQATDSILNVDIADVKAFSKIEKAKQAGIKAKDKKVVPYKLGNSYYDPEYIIDCYNILGGNITFKQTNQNMSAALLESENGVAVLLPVRPTKE